MKKFMFFGFAFVLLTSCDDKVADFSQSEQPNWADFGEANIKGTRYISEFILNSIPDNGRIAEEALNELIIKATDEYLISEGISIEDRKEANKYMEEVLSSEDEPYYDEDVTEMQASFIAALELAFRQDEDFQSTISIIEDLENQAYDLLSDEELGLVLMATTSAKYQASLWFENLEASSNNGRNLFVTSWKQVGVKAVAGGFGGAATCGVARFFGPVGWKVWGACILGGAAGVAVEEIVEQCLAPNQATAENCLRYSGGSLAECGGFLDYRNLKYKRNPYQLLRLPLKKFP